MIGRFVDLGMVSEADEVLHLSGEISLDKATCASFVREMHSRVVKQIALLARRAAAEQAVPIGWLAEKVKASVASDADPYLLMGTLIEGITHTLTSILPERGSVAKFRLEHIL